MQWCPYGRAAAPAPPAAPPHPNPQCCFVAPQTTAYQPRVCVERYAGPAPSACADCSTSSAWNRGGGGGSGGTAGSTSPAGHPVACCTYCGVFLYPITLQNTLAGPPPRCNHAWADAAAADPLRNMAHDGQTNHLCNPCAAPKLMGPTYRRD